jgi:hypothetical protein
MNLETVHLWQGRAAARACMLLIVTKPSEMASIGRS